MLFGDLGTSRLYVLGLAFYFSHHASFINIFCVNIILRLVGACYLIICRKYPDGGGVYSSAKHSSRSLAVIGGLMLCADYTVTASMSCLDAFRYLGIGGELWGVRIDLICTLVAIGLIGGINWFGPRVLFEVVVLNLVLTAAMNALPDSKLIDLGKSLMMPLN